LNIFDFYNRRFQALLITAGFKLVYFERKRESNFAYNRRFQALLITEGFKLCL